MNTDNVFSIIKGVTSEKVVSVAYLEELFGVNFLEVGPAGEVILISGGASTSQLVRINLGVNIR